MKALLALVLLAGVLSTGCFLNVTHYTAKDGSTVYVGSFYNDQPGPGYDHSARVQGKFYDASGKLITTQTGSMCQGVNPEGTVPFSVVLPAGTAPVAHVEWSIVGAPADPVLATGLEADVVQDIKGFDGNHWISGELHNNSANDYLAGFVCIAWVNANGDVVRVARGTAAGLRFSAGSALPFLVTADVPSDAVAMHFFLDAGVGTPEHPLAVVSDLPASTFQHVFQRTGPNSAGGVTALGLGEVVNSGSSPAYISVAAWMRDASGELVAAADGAGLCDVPAHPGKVSYGAYIMQAPSGTTATPTIRIESTPAINSLALSPAGLKYAAKGTGLYSVTGTVQNTTGKALRFFRVCAALYDASGEVIGVAQVYPPGGLAVGASASFAVGVPAFATPAQVKAISDGFAQ